MDKLIVENFSLNHNGNSVLDNLYLECKVGEVVGLLGRNGAGKSSLLRGIMGFYSHTGSISISRRKVNRGEIAYLPDRNFVPSNIKIIDVLNLYIDSRFKDAPAYASLNHMINYKYVVELSPGMQKLFNLYLILFSKSSFLLLDEPFNSLDPSRIDEVSSTIQYVSKSKGIIVTDHQYEKLLAISNRVVLVNNKSNYSILSTQDLITYNYLPS